MNWILAGAGVVGPLGYLAVFLGMIVEGDAVLFSAAFLTEEGLFRLVPIFFTVISGVLVGDLLWYALGAWIGKSPSLIRRWAEGIAKPFEKSLRERPLRTIFISKFTYGFHHPILMRAGSLHMKLSDYVRYDFISTLAWIAIVGGLGYFSGASFSLVKHYLKVAELGLFFILVTFFVVWHFIINRSREKL